MKPISGVDLFNSHLLDTDVNVLNLAVDMLGQNDGVVHAEIHRVASSPILHQLDDIQLNQLLRLYFSSDKTPATNFFNLSHRLDEDVLQYVAGTRGDEPARLFKFMDLLAVLGCATSTWRTKEFMDALFDYLKENNLLTQSFELVFDHDNALLTLLDINVFANEALRYLSKTNSSGMSSDLLFRIIDAVDDPTAVLEFVENFGSASSFHLPKSKANKIPVLFLLMFDPTYVQRLEFKEKWDKASLGSPLSDWFVQPDIDVTTMWSHIHQVCWLSTLVDFKMFQRLPYRFALSFVLDTASYGCSPNDLVRNLLSRGTEFPPREFARCLYEIGAVANASSVGNFLDSHQAHEYVSEIITLFTNTLQQPESMGKDAVQWLWMVEPFAVSPEISSQLAKLPVWVFCCNHTPYRVQDVGESLITRAWGKLHAEYGSGASLMFSSLAPTSLLTVGQLYDFCISQFESK